MMTTACTLLREDHQHTLAALDQLETLLSTPESPNWQAFTTQWQQLQAELAVHYACEEAALFPMIWPTRSMVLMEVEHDNLLKAEAAIDAALAAQAQSALCSAFAVWQDALRRHIKEEDEGVFPYCERHLTHAEQAHVHQAIVRLREHAQAGLSVALHRPTPALTVCDALPSASPEKPIAFSRLYQGDRLEVKRLTLEAGQQLALHWSPHQMVLVCQVGDGQLLTPDASHPYHPGDVFILTPRLLHQLVAETDSVWLQSLQALWPDRFLGDVGRA